MTVVGGASRAVQLSQLRALYYLQCLHQRPPSGGQDGLVSRRLSLAAVEPGRRGYAEAGGSGGRGRLTAGRQQTAIVMIDSDGYCSRGSSAGGCPDS